MSTDGSLSLAGSAYEVIYNTDGESHDGHGTESVCSLDSRRSDGASSFLDTDQATEDGSQCQSRRHDCEDDLEEHPLSGSEHTSSSLSQRSNSIQYADHALRTPSPHSGNASMQTLQSIHSLGRSIEFDECRKGCNKGGMAVEHTLREFSAEESRKVAQAVGIEGHSGSLIAVIRQTMSPSCLSTRRPLRILYVGSHSGRHDIILKISSALTATTASSDSVGSVTSQGSDRIYNIVPVSAFGSSNVPEVELMETSAFQIKVETCTAAHEALTEDTTSPHGFPHSAGYTLVIDDERRINIGHSSGEPILHDWEIPHVAVFFCTDTDDALTKATRDTAWEAMVSKGVPCIFISHELDFENPPSGRWRGYIDSVVPHIHLESSNIQGKYIPERLPIDLNSFLTINARQMNRNLAYITGLHPGSAGVEESISCSPKLSGCGKSSGIAWPWCGDLSKSAPSAMFLARAVLIGVLLGVGYFVGGFLSFRSADNISPAAIRSTSTLNTPTRMPTSTATVTVERTSTKTIEVSRGDTPSAPWFFDSMFWPVPGKPVFTASKGANAVLLKVDSEYSHWAIPARLRIAVHRGQEPVVAQITVHDGQAVLIELGRHDAYGVLTIQVETTQKPRIQESHEIDFGRQYGLLEMPMSYVHNFAISLATAANETARVVPRSCNGGFHALSEAVIDQAAARSSSILQHFRDVQDFTVSRARQTTRGARASFLQTRQALAKILSPSSRIHKTVDLTLVKSQISARLWWLKLQGKTQEYEKYEQQAAQFLKDKIQQLARTNKKARENTSPRPFSYTRGWW